MAPPVSPGPRRGRRHERRLQPSRSGNVPAHERGRASDDDVGRRSRHRTPGHDPSAHNAEQLVQTEVDAARHRLHAVVEEDEPSHEELEASNEVSQSANEELRSTLEELETAREELQSMNEEPQTVAQENRHEVDELGQLSNDLTNFLAAADIATIFLDRELRITRFTPTVTALFDVVAADRGRPISDLTNRLGHDGLATDAAEVLRRLVPIERELSDDRDRWFLTRLHPHRTTDERIDGVVITMVDISRRKQADETLRASERQFRATAEHLPLLVWISDATGALTWVNATYCDFVGLDRHAALGVRWRLLVHPEDLDEFSRRFTDARTRQSDLHGELRVRHADGTWRWLQLWAQPRFDAQGRFVGHLGTSADVTDRKDADEALRATAEQAAIRAELLDTLRPLDDPLAIQAEAARIIAEHLGASRVHYMRVDETGEWGTIEADHGPDLPSIVGWHRFDEHGPTIMSGMRQGRVTVVEDVAHDERLDPPHRDATLRLGIQSYAMVPLVREGRVVALMNAHQSTPRVWRTSELAILEEALTRTWSAVERAEALRAVRLSEERLRYVLDAVPSALFTTDHTGHVDMTIGQIRSLLGVGQDEVTGTLMWPDLIDGRDRSRIIAEWSRASAAGEEFEARYRIAATERWVMVRCVPIRDDGEEIVQWFGTITDVDALTTAERELADINATLEQRVLEGVERTRELASSLSRAEHDERRRLGQVLHDDLQQVLFSLQLKLGAAREMVADGGEVLDERLREVQQRLEQAIEITRSLTIDLSPPLLNTDDLETALQWLVSYMAELHHLSVTVEFEEPIDVDDDLRVMLFHIARELLFNVAKHAGTGAATVHVDRTERDLVLEVHDSGKGFDPDQLDGAGGVGLANVRERLQLFTGGLDIVSAPGAGCIITARVPLREYDRLDER